MAEFISRKRGRYKLNQPKPQKDGQKFHDKNSPDNILRKVQVHNLNYMIEYANSVLKAFDYEDKFLNIDYSFKNCVSEEFLENLKTSSLSDIICNKISSKYKTKDINTNKIIYEKIKENNVLKKIFDEGFLVFFEFYFKSKKRISLKKYGSEKEIFLPEKARTFKDLIEKNSNNEEYIKNINNCIYHYYLKGYKFLMY